MKHHTWALPKVHSLGETGRCLWKSKICGCLGLSESNVVSPPPGYPVFRGKDIKNAYPQDCDVSIIKGVMES